VPSVSTWFSLELRNSKTILDTDNDKKTLTDADDKQRQTMKAVRFGSPLLFVKFVALVQSVTDGALCHLRRGRNEATITVTRKASPRQLVAALAGMTRISPLPDVT